MAWGKLGSTTASATTDEVSSGTITANDIINNVYHVIKTGTANTRRRFNNDTGSNYASRSHVLNNEGTQINQTSIFTHADTSGNGFGISYIVNISGEEKLMIGQEVSNGSNGAGTSPKTYEGVGKWTNTSAQITEVDLLNTDSGGFLTGSNLTVLGCDMTPASAVTFPTNVQVGSRAEITDTRKMYNYENGLKYEDDFSSNGNWVFTTSNASITGGVLQCTQYRSANDSATVSVGTSIGTKFLQQFEYEVDSFPSNGSNAWYGLWSLPNTTGANTGGQDFVVLHNNDGVLHKISVGQNTSAYGGTGATGSTWITLTVGTKYYIELIGNGDDTYTLNIRTVSHTGSHVTNSPQTVTKTGLSNLQYFGFKNTTGGGNGGTVTKTDDLKIYKGTTTTTGNVWQEIGT